MPPTVATVVVLVDRRGNLLQAASKINKQRRTRPPPLVTSKGLY
jgi:hypothetical protein